MGERITGGSAVAGFGEQPTVGDTVLKGAKRLVGLGEGIEKLGKDTAAMVTVTIGNISEGPDPLLTYNPVTVLVSRTKLAELLRAEADDVGARLARILDTLYGKR
jgi:hypothetical protein